MKARQYWRTLALGGLSLAIPFLNYGASGDLIGGDAGAAWALPGEQLRQVAGVYVDTPGLGFNGAAGLAAAFPALSLAALLHAIGLPTAVVARLMIALYFFVAMSGTLRLLEALLPEGRANQLVATIGALFYGINRYTVLLYFTAQTYFPMVYAALPWLIYGIVLGCERRPARGIAVVVAALLFAGGAGANAALFGVALCALAVAAALELAQGVSPARVALVAGAGTALGLLACAWWILPLPSSVGAGLDTLSAASVPNWAGWMSERSSFLNIFKLDGYTGADIMPFAGWYASPLGSVLGYVPLAVGVAGFGAYRRRFSAVALGALLIAAFLCGGVHPPLGGIYQALLEHVPGFSIFRSPYVKWIGLEAVLLTIVFALGAAGLVARFGSSASLRANHAAAWVLGVLALAVIAYPWPAYAGRMLSPPYAGVGFVSRLPQAYRDVAAILRRRANGARTIVFNVGDQPYPMFTWGYFGQDPLDVAAAPAAVAPFETLLPTAPRMTGEALAAGLHALGVGYVAVHHDVRNLIPSPQISVLERSRAVTVVYRSSILDLYCLKEAAVPVAVLHAPVVALPRASPVPDDRISEASPGLLDPNVGLMLGERVPLEVVRIVSARLSPAWLGRLGSIRDVTDRPRDAQAGSRLTFVRANPLAVVAHSLPCGRRDGISLVSPSHWTLGGHAIGALFAHLCLARRRVPQQLEVGGLPYDDARQFAIPNGEPLEITVPERASFAGRALRLFTPGLPFALTMPRDSKVIALGLPPSAARAPFFASVNLGDGTPFALSGASTGDELTIAFPKMAHRGQRLIVYLRSSKPAVYVGLQRVRSIPFALVSNQPERVFLPVDQRLLLPLAVRGLDARQSAPPFAGPDPLLVPRWSPGDLTPASAVTVTARHLVLHSAGPPVELHTRGIVATSTRYRLDFVYRATGYAEVWTFMGVRTSERVAHLRADGRWHRFAAWLFPPPGATGTYMIRLRASAGRLETDRPRLRADGPNGVVLAWIAGERIGGSVASWSRPFPWVYSVRLDDCSPCVVRIGVSDPGRWLVGRATVDATMLSQGDSTGPWASITSGASTWVLDAGKGSRNVLFIFVPALFACAGLLISLAAVGLTAVLAVRSRASVRPAPELLAVPALPATALVSLATLALATAALGGVAEPGGELAADALFAALAVVALVEAVLPATSLAGRAALVSG